MTPDPDTANLEEISLDLEPDLPATKIESFIYDSNVVHHLFVNWITGLGFQVCVVQPEGADFLEVRQCSPGPTNQVIEFYAENKECRYGNKYISAAARIVLETTESLEMFERLRRETHIVELLLVPEIDWNQGFRRNLHTNTIEVTTNANEEPTT